MSASAEERSPGEQIKMTVSERGIGALATTLQDWLTGRLGRGLFEHASMGRHDPTGFADWSSVAP